MMTREKAWQELRKKVDLWYRTAAERGAIEVLGSLRKVMEDLDRQVEQSHGT